ncbi:hypothetical protein K8R30_01950 [archaeon]|nr:hypothetical protein [archaeon]
MKDINLFKIKDSLYLKKVSRKDEVSKDENCDGFLINSSEKEARRIIESLKGSKKKIAVVGEDDAFNRRAIESLKIDYLVSPEGSKKLDNLKQRDSGLNHVVAKIAKEKEILIVVDFGGISRLERKERAKRIARVAQNVKICRKVGCGIRIASFGERRKDVFDELGRKAFGVTIGMSSSEIRDCVGF